LGQEFNSLDAQRECAQAYILSREIISERTRDKQSAERRKGRWALPLALLF
jgi:DNA invertase Pin-like site-specific DNA recombinase